MVQHGFQIMFLLEPIATEWQVQIKKKQAASLSTSLRYHAQYDFFADLDRRFRLRKPISYMCDMCAQFHRISYRIN